jgi:tripartite-type tricarboxylate transporter receptor subunit TctC
MLKNWLCVAAAMLGLSAAIDAAQAQNYPARAITLVIPFAPGGSTSIVGRGIADKMGELLGEKVIVDNRPGAGGTVGTKAVAKSDPDGYTLLLGYTGTLAIGPSLYKNPGYDPRKDFAPIGMIGNAPNSLVVHPSFPAKTVAELIAYAKANPDKVNYGHQGKGNTGHLLGELLMIKGGFRMAEVPYRGSAPAINDLLTGNIEMVPDYLLANKQNIDTGRLKFLAVGSRERLKDYPRVATIAETLPGVYADTWMAVAAPANTPKEIARKISDAIGQGFKTPELRARILSLEAEPLGNTPDEMREMIRASEQLWGPVVSAAKISVD